MLTLTPSTPKASRASKEVHVSIGRQSYEPVETILTSGCIENNLGGIYIVIHYDKVAILKGIRLLEANFAKWENQYQVLIHPNDVFTSTMLS